MENKYILNKKLHIHIKAPAFASSFVKTTAGKKAAAGKGEKRHPVNIGLVIIVILASITTWFLTEYIVYELNQMGTAAMKWVNEARAQTGNVYYASPSGGGNGLAKSSPFQIKDFWSVANPGDMLYLLDGTYTGSNSMINPPDNLNGTADKPITIKALNDGKVLINGGTSYFPIYLYYNDYYLIEGVNCTGSDEGRSGSVVLVSTGADHNIIRRVVAWDVAPNAPNSSVFGIHHNQYNLLEDCTGFGRARKVFSSSQYGNNTTYRRCFGKWMQNASDTGPEITFTFGYRNYDMIAENVIGTWDMISSTNDEYGVFSVDSGYVDIPNTGNKVLGSIAYTEPGANYPVHPEYGVVFIKDVGDFNLKDVAIYAGANDQSGNPSRTFGLYDMCEGEICATIKPVAASITSIGNNQYYSHSDWVVSDIDHGATKNDVDSIYISDKGAKICHRYVNGVLTNDPLWPWPMDQRIYDALLIAGYEPFIVTDKIEKYFGVIPDQCRSDVQPTCGNSACDSGETCSTCPADCGACPHASGSLANSNTMTSNSLNFASDHAVEHLWDGCTDTTPACTAGAGNIASFWIEFDFGQKYDLTQARLFGDTTGNWQSRTWQLQYKVNSTDFWSTAFSGTNAFLDDWSTKDLNNLTARYVRVAVFGNPDIPATQARELEIYGTLNTEKSLSPGLHTITLTATDAEGKTTQDTIQIEILPQSTLIAQINLLDTEYNQGDTIYFTAQTSGGTSPYTYSWKSDKQGVFSTTQWPTVNTSAWQTGTHLITLTVTDATSKTATDQINITINPAGAVCGNSVCDSGETCTSCPADCGSCADNSVYIDPAYSGANGPEDGSFSRPYNSWKDFTIQAGKDYRQKCGTTAIFTSSLTISALETSGTLVIGAYYNKNGTPMHEDDNPRFGQFCGNGAEKPVIKDNESYPGTIVLFRTLTAGAQNLEFNSLQIRDSYTMMYLNSNKNIVRYCYIKSIVWGIRIGFQDGGGQNNLIEYNYIDGDDPVDEDGIGVDMIRFQTYARYNTVQYNHITGYDHMGIDFSGSDYNIVQYNYIYGAKGNEDGCAGATLDSDKNIVRYNFCKNAWGFQLLGATSFEVYGNIVTCGDPSWRYNGRGCLNIQSLYADSRDYPTSGNKIYNNTIYLANETYNGFGVKLSAVNNPGTIENNIIANNIIRAVGYECVGVLDSHNAVGTNYYYNNSCFDYVGSYAEIEGSNKTVSQLNAESYASGNREGGQGLYDPSAYKLWPASVNSDVVGTGMNLSSVLGTGYDNRILDPSGTDLTASPPKVKFITQPANWHIGAYGH